MYTQTYHMDNTGSYAGVQMLSDGKANAWQLSCQQSFTSSTVSIFRYTRVNCSTIVDRTFQDPPSSSDHNGVRQCIPWTNVE